MCKYTIIPSHRVPLNPRIPLISFNSINTLLILFGDSFLTLSQATDFHNSVGIEFSVAHKLDLKTPGNAYKTSGKIGIEVFHCFNSLEGAQELAKVFNPDSPIFAGQPKYKGPYSQTIWKVMDDVSYA